MVKARPASEAVVFLEWGDFGRVTRRLWRDGL